MGVQSPSTLPTDALKMIVRAPLCFIRQEIHEPEFSWIKWKDR